jgi:hypothetical protein
MTGLDRANRRSGIGLVLMGLCGAVFFWLSDPRYGPAMHRAAEAKLDWRYWLFVLRGSPDNLIDAANQARISTLVGVVGSAALLIVGFWLFSRRTA